MGDLRGNQAGAVRGIHVVSEDRRHPGQRVTKLRLDARRRGTCVVVRCCPAAAVVDVGAGLVAPSGPLAEQAATASSATVAAAAICDLITRANLAISPEKVP